MFGFLLQEATLSVMSYLARRVMYSLQTFGVEWNGCKCVRDGKLTYEVAN